MGILDKIIKDIGKCKLDDQVRQICDMIIKEEEYVALGPEGPNIFLSNIVSTEQVKKQKALFTYVNYITLEREAAETFVIRQWTRRFKDTENKKTIEPLKLIRNWEVKKYDKAEKVLKEFAEKLKYLKGE